MSSSHPRLQSHGTVPVLLEVGGLVCSAQRHRGGDLQRAPHHVLMAQHCGERPRAPRASSPLAQGRYEGRGGSPKYLWQRWE